MAYTLLTIILSVLGVLVGQRLYHTYKHSLTFLNAVNKPQSHSREASFAEIMKINDNSSQHGIFDPITGLPDRQIFDERLQKTLMHSKQYNQIFSVMVLNIDEFENISNIYGDVFANKLLAETANRLRTVLRQIDTLSRYVGNNFFFILPELSSSEIAISVAQRIQDSMAIQFSIDDNQIFVTASIGIAIFDPDSDTVSSIIKKAEDALTDAKLAGRNTYRIFHSSERTAKPYHYLLNSHFDESSYLKKMVLQYQAYYDIYNNRSCSIHANILFNDEESGLIPFQEFCDVAEENDKAHEICIWQLRKVIEQVHVWETNGFKPDNILITVPFKQIVDAKFINDVNKVFDETYCSKSKIIFDIIEPNYSCNKNSVQQAFMKLLHDGIQLCMSVLVLGRLPLKNITELPITYLKLDKGLVSDLFANTSNEPIVTSLIALINNSSIEIIAEGIDMEYQKKKLLKLGCSKMRGKLFTSPASASEIFESQQVSKKESETV